MQEEESLSGKDETESRVSQREGSGQYILEKAKTRCLVQPFSTWIVKPFDVPSRVFKVRQGNVGQSNAGWQCGMG